jgi:hypothetical protein
LNPVSLLLESPAAVPVGYRARRLRVQSATFPFTGYRRYLLAAERGRESESGSLALRVTRQVFEPLRTGYGQIARLRTAHVAPNLPEDSAK